MAYMTNSRGEVRTDLLARIAGAFKAAGSRMDQYRVYRRTVNELSTLSDRELADLGINRSMIVSIASEAAYGA